MWSNDTERYMSNIVPHSWFTTISQLKLDSKFHNTISHNLVLTCDSTMFGKKNDWAFSLFDRDIHLFVCIGNLAFPEELRATKALLVLITKGYKREEKGNECEETEAEK